MTDGQITDLIKHLSESYDIASAAKKAGVPVADARHALDDNVRKAIDNAVLERVLGSSAELTKQAVAEFRRIAFSDDESSKTADRIRAIEQLFRLLPSADPEAESGQTPPLVVVYDYNGAGG